MAYKGVNYGKLITDGDQLLLSSFSGNNILKINYNTIQNSTVNKNDVVVETTIDQVGNQDCLCQIRFYVEDQKQQEKQMEIEGEEENQKKQTRAESIYKSIVEKAKIGEFAGESIATLLDVNLAVPRGKYTVDFYQKNIRFHGMTFNYNIEYRNITKGFILPMNNESQIAIVLQLNKDKPIYQGQTVYRYIVLQIKRDAVVQIKTKVNPELLDKAPNLKQLNSQYSGSQYQVFGDLLHAIGGQVLVQPGNHFKSKDNQPCIKASVKAQPGWLYMLKNSIIFITKPVLYFHMNDISVAQFVRTNAVNKQFDLKLSLKQQKKNVQFLNIERNQLEALVEYFKSKNIKIIMEQSEQPKIMPEAEDDSEEDQDFDGAQQQEQSSSSEDSQQPDEVGSEEDSESKDKKQKRQKKKENDGKKQDKQEEQ